MTRTTAGVDWVSQLHESAGEHIRLLTQRRHVVLKKAATCRRDGQLVPGSLTQELAENASELRDAMERYRQGRLLRQPGGSAPASASSRD